MNIDNNSFIKTPKILFIWVMLIYCLLTLVGILTHEPWFDEAQAWLISQDLNFIDLLNYMKYEGHLFIWYLLLMPFTKLNMPYPMPMLVLNMLFMWAAVYVLWTKLPFNNIIKILITFSVPVCYQYAVVARCYSVGILLLFLLIALYPEKLKKPYLYAFLIILCANTSVMALIGAAAFGFLFFIDYIVNNKGFYKSKQFWLLFLIALFGVGIVLYQLLGSINQVKDVLYSHQTPDSSLNVFISTVSFGLSNVYTEVIKPHYFVVIFYLIFSFLAFIRSFRTLFFFVFTFISLSLIFIFIHNAEFWHQYFYYIYFIISLALLKYEGKQKNIFSYLLIIFLVVVSFNGCYETYDRYCRDIYGDFSESKKFSEFVVENKDVLNSNLYIGDLFSHTFIPYFRNKGVVAYDPYTSDVASFFDLSKNSYWTIGTIDDDMILPQNKEVYLIISTTTTFDDLESEKYDFELVHYIEPSYLVKLIPKN